MRKSSRQKRRDALFLERTNKKKEHLSKLNMPTLFNSDRLVASSNRRNFNFGNSIIDNSSFSLGSDELGMNYLVTGATQQGKSYFSVNLLSKLAEDASLVVLDPHGEMVKELLEIFSLVPGMKKRIVYWDINSTEHIIGYNPFEKKDYLSRDKQLDMIKSAILTSWNDISFDQMPRLERWISLGIDVLYSANLSFREAEYLFSFSDAEKRNQILQKCDPNFSNLFDDETTRLIEDPNIYRFITDFKWLESQSKSIQYQEIGSSYNRIFKFIYSDTAKKIFGQTKNVIDIRDIIDNKKILLVDLKSANAGLDVSRLLASLLMNEINSLMNVRLDAFGREGCMKRKCYVAIDEFSSVANNTITSALSQTNKAGIYWILITQFLAQIELIDDRALDDVLTNCKGKIVFGGMTMKDCELLSSQMFAGQLNLSEVKNYVDTYVPKPTLVKLIDHSRTEGKSWSNSNSRSLTNGTSESSSSGNAETSSDGSGSTYNSENTISTYNDNRGFSSQSSQSQSSSSSNSESITKGESRGESTSNTITEKNSYVTFYDKKVIPGQFYSLEEQKYKSESIMQILPKGCAIVKIGNSLPATPIAINSRNSFLPSSIKHFLNYIYTYNSFYIDSSEAQKGIKERHDLLFGNTSLNAQKNIESLNPTDGNNFPLN